jgi:hypothetical protein
MELQDRRRRLVIATIIGFSAAFAWMIVGLVTLLTASQIVSQKATVLQKSDYVMDILYGVCTGGVLSLSVGLQGWTIKRPQRVWQLALASICASTIVGCAIRFFLARDDMAFASLTLMPLPTLAATIAAFAAAGLFIGVQEKRRTWFTVASGLIGSFKALTLRLLLSENLLGSLWIFLLAQAVPVFYFIAFHVFLGLEWGIETPATSATGQPTVPVGSKVTSRQIGWLVMCAVVPGVLILSMSFAIGRRQPSFHGWYGKTEELAEFVKNNPDSLNQRDELGETLLMQAVRFGKREHVQWLLEHGADVNQADSLGQTPLSDAAERDKMDVAVMLIEKGANVNAGGSFLGPPLFCAIEKKNDDMIELLQNKGADLNAQNALRGTPLHAAVHAHDRNAVEFLLSHGADPTRKNSSNETPLDLARKEGMPKIVELLEAGSSASNKNP